MKKEHINPLKHHRINEIEKDDISIIFFKNDASMPEQNNAKNLNWISFLRNVLIVNFSSLLSITK